LEGPLPTPNGDGALPFAQFLYKSPMGANCKRNFTIHIAGAGYWACRNIWVPRQYLLNHECIPDANMMAAYTVDIINEKQIVPGMCLQLSVSEYEIMGSLERGDIVRDIKQAVNVAPTKHGFISSDWNLETAEWATTLRAFGLPIIDGNYGSSGTSAFGNIMQYPTLLRLDSDKRSYLDPLLSLLPKKFAMLSDDSMGGSYASVRADIFLRLKKMNKEIVLAGYVPQHIAGKFHETLGPTNEFVKAMREGGIRYLFLVAGANMDVVLACSIHQLDIDPQLVQVVNYNGCSGELTTYLLPKDAGCTHADIIRVHSNGGWIGVQGVSGAASVEDDIQINLWTGQQYVADDIKQDLGGNPWPASSSLAVSPTSTCKDDEASLKSNTLVRSLLDPFVPDVIKCQDMNVYGQSLRFRYIEVIAKYCPISACNYNKYSAACRISCACTDQSLKTNPGSPLCTKLELLPRVYNMYTDLPPSEFRCDGKACRPLPWYPSSFAYVMMGMEYSFNKPDLTDWELNGTSPPAGWDGVMMQPGMTYKGKAGFCRGRKYGSCAYLASGSPSKYAGIVHSTSVWAYSLAYKCIYDKHGDQGLDRLENFDYIDEWVTNELMDCLRSKVAFEGVHGRVNFSFYGSPPAGFTINGLVQPASAAGRGGMVSGDLSPTRARVSSRYFSRKNHSACKSSMADFSPIMSCPENSTIWQTPFDTEESLEMKLLLPFPQECPIGAYPLAEGEENKGKLNSCHFCDAGTYKAKGGTGRCFACDTGKFSREGSNGCVRCAAGTETPHQSTSEMIYNFSGWAILYQLRGYGECVACPAGKYQDHGVSSQCLACGAGKFSNQTGSSECLSCPAGTYNAISGVSVCSFCPGGSMSAADAEKLGDCHCMAPGYGDPEKEGCKQCSAGRETTRSKATSSDACTLQSVVLAGIASGCSCVCVAIIVMVLGRGFLKKRLAKWHALQEQMTEEKIDAGLQSLVALGHPMVVISAKNFTQLSFETLGGLHEVMRDSGLLLTLDTIESVIAFKQSGKSLVLFSYQWLSWVRSGPNEVQNNAMINSVINLCKDKQITLDDVYIWLDILSIPQCHPALKKLAVYSLYVYAGLSDYLLIIAPPSMHEATKTVADHETYKSRVWCRAEQLAHFCKTGMDTMYLCRSEEGFLEPLSKDWIGTVCRVFDGEMTCCRLLHKREGDGGLMRCDRESLVSTLLGLYFEVYTSTANGDGSEAKLEMQKLIAAEKVKIFPSTFPYPTEKGTEHRELFGDMIQRVERVIDADAVKAKRRCMQSHGLIAAGGVKSIAMCAPADSASRRSMLSSADLEHPVLLGARPSGCKDDDQLETV